MVFPTALWVRFASARRPAGLLVAIALLAGLTAASSAAAASGRFASGIAEAQLESPAAPVVTNVAPGVGPIAGGTEVNISGKNLTGASEVRFGTNAASFSVKSSIKITAVAPPGAEGTTDVTVVTPEGTSATSRADHFSYIPTGPAVVELIPNEGPVAGGHTIKIVGGRFEDVSEVTFGGKPAAFEVVTPEAILATTPEGSEPTVDVRVITPEGVSPIWPADQYHYSIKAIEISGASPSKGPAAGGNTVTIGGVEFYGVTGVEFGSTPATGVSRNSSASITAIAPPNTAERIELTVLTTFGESQSEFCFKQSCSVRDHYKYVEPTVKSVTPGNGSKSGGTGVTITGSGFGLGENETEVLFGKTPATGVDCTSITTCTAVAPPAAKAGLAAVEVSIKSNEPKKSKKNPAAEFDYE